MQASLRNPVRGQRHIQFHRRVSSTHNLPRYLILSLMPYKLTWLLFLGMTFLFTSNLIVFYLLTLIGGGHCSKGHEYHLTFLIVLKLNAVFLVKYFTMVESIDDKRYQFYGNSLLGSRGTADRVRRLNFWDLRMRKRA